MGLDPQPTIYTHLRWHVVDATRFSSLARLGKVPQQAIDNTLEAQRRQRGSTLQNLTALSFF